MGTELDRVSENEEFTLWQKLIHWIYWKLFDNKYHIKAKQNDFEKQQSAKAFEKITRLLKPEKDNSMTDEKILKHTRKNFKNED